VGRVFGGQVIAQALASAQNTVDADRAAHSLHAYFLRGGSEDHEIAFRVERDFDGGSFSNRRVVASQQGTPILNLIASFQKRVDGFSHQDPMPETTGPEGLQRDIDVWKENLDRMDESLRILALRQSAIDLRPTNKLAWMGIEKGPPRLSVWLRTVAALPDDPRIHRSVLAYASDLALLATCGVPHGVNWTSGEMKSASLDHAVWFHEDFRADDWLLYDMDSPWAGHARGFNRGRIFTRDGRLVAEVAQEGMVRVLAKS
jgi:acyl-CoA thioesterase-2